MGWNRHPAFQSLFWWNVVTYQAKWLVERGPDGFQSLFWWNVVTYMGWHAFLLSPSIVSILVLVECSYLHACCSGLSCPGRFQSLFWWNVVTYRRGPRAGRCPHSPFQSLFWWNVVTYRAGINLFLAADEVSILVLVECSYLRDITPRGAKTRCVSILVLMEGSFLLNLGLDCAACHSLFQSLF